MAIHAHLTRSKLQLRPEALQSPHCRTLHKTQREVEQHEEQQAEADVKDVG